MSLRWDIFCKVVDNYGDIGVCWRLARQLSLEYEFKVRLWVDDLTTAKKLIPSLDTSKNHQVIEGIAIDRWQRDFADTEVADVVIETFACDLPETYLAAMAIAKPVWVNLDYLSAEHWVNEFHAQPSPQPALCLTRYFFFPGFCESTGGLIREQRLLNERDAFQASVSAQQSFWQALNVDNANLQHLKISLFTYPHAPIASLLDCLACSTRPVQCLVPESNILPAVAKWLGITAISAGTKITRGSLTLQVLPFLSQSDYDKLLWACDINFVRGEDSWVRAIWAAKPFIWLPYLQEEGAHITKLQAFIDSHYANSDADGLDADTLATLQAIYLTWCAGQIASPDWQVLMTALPVINDYHVKRASQLAQQSDLAAKLVIFCRNRL